jgi:hypothetical protein
MPGRLIPGRPLEDGDRLSRREFKARAAYLIKSVKDPAVRKALRFLFQKMDRPLGQSS